MRQRQQLFKSLSPKLIASRVALPDTARRVLAKTNPPSLRTLIRRGLLYGTAFPGRNNKQDQKHRSKTACQLGKAARRANALRARGRGARLRDPIRQHTRCR